MKNLTHFWTFIRLPSRFKLKDLLLWHQVQDWSKIKWNRQQSIPANWVSDIWRTGPNVKISVFTLVQQLSLKCLETGTSNSTQPNSTFNKAHFCYPAFLFLIRAFDMKGFITQWPAHWYVKAKRAGCMKGVGIMRLAHSPGLSEIAKK